MQEGFLWFLTKQLIAKNIYMWREQHFQHHLRSVNYNYFTLNIIHHQACSFISEIHMHLTASSALVDVKCRAVDPVYTVKVSPLED
jgi:hypothetical protein